MKKISFLIIATITLFYYVEATLSVYNAQSLGLNATDLGLQNIGFSIANFGFVPFGKTMIGQLVISPGLSDQCTFMQDSQINEDQNYFMIVPRGNCKFVPKALNAQKAGAKIVIIMDNETYSEQFTMADNGEGYKVKIPAIFINHEDGAKLIETIDKAKQKKDKLVVKITFQNQKSDKILLKLYLQASKNESINVDNRRTYKLVSDFQQFYERIVPFVDLQLVYQSEACDYCLEKDCYYRTQYCSYGYKNQEGANGKEILAQQIRELIVFQKYPLKWWGWMAYIGDQCSFISQLKECSEEGMKKFGIDAQIIQTAFTQSFTKDGDNKYLKLSNQGLRFAGVNKFPAASINGYNMKGTLSAQYLFDDLCNTLNVPPPQCSPYVNETVVVTYVKQYWSLIFIIVIAGFIIFSGLFILYKRYMKKKMSSDMRNRVDDMVSKYIEFYSERSGNR